MATELDILPQDFYEVIHEIACNVGTEEYAPVVRDYCERLAEENARLRPMLTARSQEMLRLVSESGELKTRAEKAEARVQELETLNRELDFKLHDQELLAKANAEHASQRGQRVRELERENGELRSGIPTVPEVQWKCAEKEMVRLRERLLTTQGKLRSAEAELAALKARIAEAPVSETVCDELIDPGRAYAYIDGNNVAYVIGRRVRLLVEDGE